MGRDTAMEQGMAGDVVLEAHGLTRDFAVGLGRWRVRAVESLDLTVRAGEVVGLLGPNGSGKSTTLKMILGLLEPTAGTVRLWGQPPADPRARARLGYLPEEPIFPGFLTPRELVSWHAGLAGMPRAERAAATDAALAKVGLDATAGGRRLDRCSRGMRQRAALATALVHDPELLILDEPTSGLDPLTLAEWTDWIRAWRAQGRTVLVCSHQLAEVEAVCDRVVVMHRGRRVAEGRWSELLAEPGRWQATVASGDGVGASELAAWLARRGARLEAWGPATRPLERFYREALGAGPLAGGKEEAP